MGRASRWVEAAWLSVVGVGLGVASLAGATLPTTLKDFFQGGTQPIALQQSLTPATSCMVCHAGYTANSNGYTTGDAWAASLMGQSSRDPIFHAALVIANQDADFAGEFCLRCHMPMGWLRGRSTPPDGSDLTGSDFEGVSCSICHRMVDPVYQPGVSPLEDNEIIANLPKPPRTSGGETEPAVGNASYVMDPLDRRRGPYANIDPPHAFIPAPFQRSSAMCATCHEVSNPAYSRQPDGSYLPNEFNASHPTANRYDMFPEQRTYSEWAMSAFANQAFPLGQRYGSNQVNVQSCQDCHMPRMSGFGAEPDFGAVSHDDLAKHTFAGANTWVLRAVRSLYPDSETFLTEASVNASVERAFEMLRDASDLELSQRGNALVARVVNQTGHKLPTGYPEGRRIWVNVKFFSAQNQVLAERGAYNAATATLVENDTKVYQAEFGVDAAGAAATGLPVGKSFHLVLNNKLYSDNRIPPRGFTNAGFASVQASPVGYSYADGQFWDDTIYAIPAGAARAEVRVFYQTTSREYIEFLRDANITNSAGQVAFDQWVLHGKSAPAEMDSGSFTIGCAADVDDGTGAGVRDGGVEITDLLYYLALFETGALGADVDDGSGSGTPDNGVTIEDLLYYLLRFSEGC